jgi:sulfotransferase family protein
LARIKADGESGVTRIIWLASYPKSGNTWFRMLVANLSAKDGQPVDINDLPERGGIASARGPFDYLSLIDSGLLTHDEVDCLRPRVYEELASGALDDEYDKPQDVPPVRFVKVHDAYRLTPKDEPVLAGRRGAQGAIVIVRDPRDVAPSLANHSNSSIDDAISFMSDNDAAYCAATSRQHSQLRQKLPGWSGHTESWLDQTDIPVYLIRYEDMQSDTIGVFRGALDFAGLPASDEDIRRAVSYADFAELRRQEQDKGFRETPRLHLGRPFFRRGEAGAWRDELSAEQVARIEAAHGPMMRRLGYELASTMVLARTA